VHAFTLQWHGAPAGSQFTLYEDDGASVDYQQGGLRTTVLSQQTQQQSCTITIAAAKGDFAGAPTQRRVLIKAVFGTFHQQVCISFCCFHKCCLVGRIAASWDPVQSVTLNGNPVKQVPDVATLNQVELGWVQVAPSEAWIKSPVSDVHSDRVIVINKQM
jgi:alpha-glucosidase